MLGLAAPCSTLTSMRRLTSAAAASWSSVQRRDCRACFTRAPIAVASALVLLSIQCIILHPKCTGWRTWEDLCACKALSAQKWLAQAAVFRVDGSHDAATDFADLFQLGLGQRVEDEAADGLRRGRARLQRLFPSHRPVRVASVYLPSAGSGALRSQPLFSNLDTTWDSRGSMVRPSPRGRSSASCVPATQTGQTLQCIRNG